MEHWGFNPASVSAIGSAVSAAAVIVAVIGLVVAYRQERRARNLQAFLEISGDMRRRWAEGWDVLLRETVPKLNLQERSSGEVGRELHYMLNWLDWMGLIVKMNLIDKQLLFGSLFSVVREIIRESADIIQNDIDNPARGERWWGNVLFLAREPEIDLAMPGTPRGSRRSFTTRDLAKPTSICSAPSEDGRT